MPAHRLLVLRHAKSSWDDASLADHDRPLAARGQRDLPALARVLAVRGSAVTHVLCSSAARTQATLDGVRPALPTDVEVVVDPALYDADARTLLARCRRLGQDAGAAVGDVLLVGHNPAVEELVAQLTGDATPAAHQQLRTKVPTGALAQLTVPAPWTELRAGTGHLDVLLVPKALPDAATDWAEQLARWRVPEHLPTPAADDERFEVERFARIADQAVHLDSPSRRRAREVLQPGGAVLDVGCGAGAGSLPLVPPAGRLIGVDVQDDMLAAYATRGGARGAVVTTVEGSWPEVADRVPQVEVAVCHNVLFGVGDLVAFTAALTRRARRRVVVEIPQRHPLRWLTPLWRELHGIERPEGPTSDDAARVIQAAGYDVHVEHWTKRRLGGSDEGEEPLRFARRRLRLDPSRDDELRAALAAHPQPRERPTTTLWWDVP
ncbi:MAG: methyltransferase domain-containing protein [Nitriliruptoraceae bacterium]